MLSFLKSLFKPSADFSALVKQGAVIVDVRSPREFGSGNLAGSRNIPLDNLKKEIEHLKQLNKPIITICQSGGRSGIAKGMLKAAGVEVYNGGGWRSFQNKIQS